MLRTIKGSNKRRPILLATTIALGAAAVTLATFLTLKYQEKSNLYTLIVYAGNPSSIDEYQFPDGSAKLVIKVAPNTKMNDVLSTIDTPCCANYDKHLTFDEFYYINEKTRESEPVTDDTKITYDYALVFARYRKKTLEECSWSEISEISALGADFASQYFDLAGREEELRLKTVMINNQPHRVRLIGYGQDYTDLPEPGEAPDPNNAIGITFEFVDVISDYNGYSLATYWNDVASEEGSNYNYKDSSVRAALNGKYDDPEKGSTKDINWFQYFGTEHDTDLNKQFSQDFAGKSVYDMLPEDLKSVIKTADKYINIWNGTAWEEQTVKDKLFLLSPVEMGGFNDPEFQPQEEHTTQYSYYYNQGGGPGGDRCIKKQIKKHEGVRENPAGMGQYLSGDLDGLYTGTKYSYAGFDLADDSYKDTYLWLRSPLPDSEYPASYSVAPHGIFGAGNVACQKALNIAPAFCV